MLFKELTDIFHLVGMAIEVSMDCVLYMKTRMGYLSQKQMSPPLHKTTQKEPHKEPHFLRI